MGKSSLKILHILDHSLPVHDGYALRSQAICLAQKSRGWEPAIVTSPKHHDSDRRLWADSEQIGDLRYYRTPAVPSHIWPIAGELRLIVTLAKRIAALVRQERPDLLHAHSPILNAIPALWVSRRTGIPFVYEMRALWEDAAVDHGTYGQHSWKYTLVKALETWICRNAAHVAVLCDGLRDDLIQRGIPSEKLTAIPNGVNTDVFRMRGPELSFRKHWNLTGKKVIGFIGSFFRYEGLDLLVEAMAQLTVTRSDVVLLLVGGGRMEAELKAQIQRLSLETYVVMPGPIAQERIPGVYALVDILAYPRHSIRLTELVTPLKPLEAMAMGKAIVASDVGGHRELIQHDKTGLLVTAGSASALAQGLARLLDDHGLREALGRQGATWVQRERSWHQTTAAYSGVYSKALEGTGLRFPENGSYHPLSKPSQSSPG